MDGESVLGVQFILGGFGPMALTTIKFVLRIPLTLIGALGIILFFDDLVFDGKVIKYVFRTQFKFLASRLL